MLVSVILTCYKQEKYIEGTILSVINQSYKDRELLIWDDSPDNKCRNIISKYVKEYPDKIYAWHHDLNKWIVNNMQFLINHKDKNSEYIAFLEWDDCLFPEYLEKKIEIFNKYPNVQLVYNELTTIDKNWKIIENNRLKRFAAKFCKRWKISYENLISKKYNETRSGIMVRSEVVNKYPILYAPMWAWTILSDLCFFNQIAHNEDIYGIKNPLIYYRKHDDSVSGNIKGKVNIYFEIIKYIDCLFKQWLIDWNFYKEQIWRHYLFISIITVKKFLSIWIFRAAKVFIIEYIKSIKNRFKRLNKQF